MKKCNEKGSKALKTKGFTPPPYREIMEQKQVFREKLINNFTNNYHHGISFM